MKKTLKDYYNMDVDYIENGYFRYNYKYYYIMEFEPSFLEVYSCYDFVVHLLNKNGYRIVKNCYDQIVSDRYILLMYNHEPLNIFDFLKMILKPLERYHLSIKEVKERWIEKIDNTKKEVSKYAYSFQYNRDLNALIHYYCGMAENAIVILNEILLINKDLQLTLCLSLKKTISPYYYELLNPGNYTISSKARHILNMLKSGIISFRDFEKIINYFSFDSFELLYLFARSFYCSEFFELIIAGNITEDDIQFFMNKYKKDKLFIKTLKEILTKYITLPEISWID